jgi:hypothetical protein
MTSTTTTTRTTETIKTHPALTVDGTAVATVITSDFGMVDDKGRKIGYRVEIFAHVAFGDRDAGFVAYVTVTRDGAAFGTGSYPIFGSSAAAVELAAAHKAAAARARYVTK